MIYNFNRRSIKSDYSGYEELINFFTITSSLQAQDIHIDFSNIFFNANLCAVLGAMFEELQKRTNRIFIQNVDRRLITLLKRNKFLTYFGSRELPDYYKTVIKYSKFGIHELKIFNEYLQKDLLSAQHIPQMSERLTKKINESLLELFDNAVAHGECVNIFSCGQYYPIHKALDFTVVDIGTTIQENVNNYLRENCSATEAIDWAVKDGNTTKIGSIPGGLGLYLIREFLKINKGKIQIISSDGFWEETNGKVIVKKYSNAFPGTIVNIEFNIDEKYYCFKSEINDIENNST